MTNSLGRIGLWAGQLRAATQDEAAAAAREAEKLGFGAIWMPGGIDDTVLGTVGQLLDATSRISYGTGIINIWRHKAADVASWYHAQSADRQARVMLGLGVSHGPLIGDSYAKPLAKMVEYLDELDALGVPKERRCLAAIAPKMLDLARERSAGSHPYLMPPEHSAVARERLGPDALLAPELGVVLDSNPVTARATALAALSHYFIYPNYVNNWRRLGYSEEDVKGSDKLVDAVIAWGDVQQIASRVKAHLDAGAHHVCLQVIRPSSGQPQPLPVAEWRELAGALFQP